jgi:nucleoside-diphosphate-sugar epimerase
VSVDGHAPKPLPTWGGAPIRLAVTGATGFVGRAFLARAVAMGHHVRALTRRPQQDKQHLTWIRGDLANPGALAQGTDVVVHIAGVVNADRDGFVAGNVDGTRTMIAAAKAAKVRRFVHVSSLSAREPQLSNYGWSKREGEKLVEASGLDWTIVRPTGIYGPGDTELLDLFRMASKGFALLPPRGRVSLIAVDDLAALLLLFAGGAGERTIYEVDDGSGGMTHAELAHAIGAAVEHKVVPIHLPRPVLTLAAMIDQAVRGDKAKLTRDRVGYLCHDDWTANPARRPPVALWKPQTRTREGLAATAAWYRAHRMV